VKVAALVFFLMLGLPVRTVGGGEPVPVVLVEPPVVATVETHRVYPEPELTVQDEVMAALLDLGYTPVVFECVAIIFDGESDWRWDITAADTGGFSYGLGQRHGPTWGAPPDPWPIADQTAWFSVYAEERYGGWCPAAAKWLERAAVRNGRGWW
jgi:hypothetical protein